MNNFDYSFFQFSSSKPSFTSCGAKLQENSQSLRYGFFLDLVDASTDISVGVYDKDDNELTGLSGIVTNVAGNKYHFLISHTISNYDAKCMYIGVNYTIDGTVNHAYSNLIYNNYSAELTDVQYRCYEDSFSFPYDGNTKTNRLKLPILANKPQYPQDDKIYVDGNGVRNLLYSKISKENEFETEYLPTEWHEKIVVMLGHDNVLFNGTKIQKTGEYEIDYDNEDKLDCGLYLYKAKAKVSTNTIIRNSMC